MSSTTVDRIRSWESEGAYVLHRPTGTIGRAGHYFDGVREQYTPPKKDGEDKPTPVQDPVLLVGPNSFVVKNPEIFVELTPQAARFFSSAHEHLAEFMRGAMVRARSFNVEPEEALAVLEFLLRDQLQKIKA